MGSGNFDHIYVGSLGRRAAEIVVLIDAMFPGPRFDGTNTVFEFIDVNPDLKRILVADSSGQYKSPWRSNPCTLTGKSQVVVRITDADGCIVRQVASAELFAMCGWYPSAFKRGISLPDVELSSSLCGNCFSAFHIGPVLMALFSIVDTGPEATLFSEQQEQQAQSEAESESD